MPTAPERPQSSFDWFRGLVALLTTASVPTALAFGGSGIALLVGPRFFGLHPGIAFVGGYLVSQAAVAAWFQSGACLSWRIGRWKRLVNSTDLKQEEFEKMKKQAVENYRRHEVVRPAKK